MKKNILTLIILWFSFITFLKAQDSNIKLFFKGGISEYGSVQGIRISGGGGPGPWYVGPMFGPGLEYDLNRNWFLQGTFEYSQNIYGGLVPITETMERGKNTVVDIMSNIKKRWDWFYLIGGIGFSFQQSTDSFISGNYEGENYRRRVYQGDSNVVLTGLMGFGLEVYPIEYLGIFLEGSWRIRVYVTPVAQLGINYKM